ncbi:hypothetical protein H257_06445 [Aphanomyces astaci]|uniref:Phosphatidylinositol 3-kinase n=1 Tax=Aphanomyces astaci TaxID=112090 RepID=W4GNU0_APHAT|nr:hypothetical protein H257_06445 [Aphanomyces astaci]ETV81011.1 hypothetical protein H257_06445 [Aphanomyces astaci]|eukprot:XP_009829958.1 hypothetical protein H257_06445 [Aphanomyces astaci]
MFAPPREAALDGGSFDVESEADESESSTVDNPRGVREPQERPPHKALDISRPWMEPMMPQDNGYDDDDDDELYATNQAVKSFRQAKVSADLRRNQECHDDEDDMDHTTRAVKRFPHRPPVMTYAHSDARESVDGSSFYSTTLHDPHYHANYDHAKEEEEEEGGDFPSTAAVYNTRHNHPPARGYLQRGENRLRTTSPAAYSPIVLADSSDSEDDPWTMDQRNQQVVLDGHMNARRSPPIPGVKPPPAVLMSAIKEPQASVEPVNQASRGLQHDITSSPEPPHIQSPPQPHEQPRSSLPRNEPTLTEPVGDCDSDGSISSEDNSVGSSPANSLVLDSVYETVVQPSAAGVIVLPPSTSRRTPHQRRDSTDPVSTWYPAPALVHTATQDSVSAQVRGILQRKLKRLSKEALEIKACMPEYRLEKADWMLARKRQSDLHLLTISVVARLPMDVLDSMSGPSELSNRSVSSTSHCGYLLKRGQVNVAMQRRYMVLQHNQLVYYKTNPELNKGGWFGKEKPRGSLHLANVSLVRPYLTTLTLELVTTNRTWVLQAETDGDYKAWARAICRSVPYQVVDVVFRRMFQLAQVDASNVNEVRVVALPSYTVLETVEHIFVNYVQMAGALPLKPVDPSDFCLKVTGYRDYMVNPTASLDQYSHVQDCLCTKTTLCLTILHRNCIATSIQQAILGDHQRLSAGSEQQSPTAAVKTYVDPVVGSGKYLYPVQFAVHQVQSLSRQDKSTHVVVVADLVYGGERLEKVADSAEVRLVGGTNGGKRGGRWPQPPRWHKSALNVSALPKETRLVLTVYGFQPPQMDKWTLLATGGVNVFDADDMLIQGDLTLPLLEGPPSSCYTGPLSQVVQMDQPFIQITVATPNLPVKFDWSTHWGTVESRDRSLDRSGWLSERPPTGLVWTDKWVQLTQSTRSLVLFADNKSTGGPHQSLPLDGATVEATDALNRRHTTKLTPSTRREQQTWAFQLQLQGSSRVYVLAARTRHERDAWVKTIQLVASSSDVLSDMTCRDSDQTTRTSLIGQFAKPVGLAQAAADLGEFDYLVQVIDENPLYQLCGFEKAVLWRHRRALLGSFEALPRLLTCVNWLDPGQKADLLALLPSWTSPRHPTSYITLLECVDSCVRRFAVDRLAKLTDSAFRQIIPQLVQAVKGDAHHTSPLSSLLVERALTTPTPLGVDLFWALKVETHVPQHRERFGLLLNAYVDVCCAATRSMLHLQDTLFAEGGRLEVVCAEIKRLKASGASDKDMQASLHSQLDLLNAALPEHTYQLPVDSRVEVGKLVVPNCRVMSSAKLPLWLEFENAEAGTVAVIFKSGDDLRQDVLVLQLLRVMDDLWRDNSMDLALDPYRCVATGPTTGLVQVVPHAATTAAIQSRSNRGILGAFHLDCFSNWIDQHNTTPKKVKAAKDLFRRSCAGYCVASLVLGIGDRHNDNLMVTTSGRYFHIDFGHFLGYFKYVPLLGMVNIKRERTPFVFTPQMSHVFGGEHSPGFAKFIKTGADALNVVRRHFHVLMSLLLLMLPAQLPELRHRDDLNYVVDTIAPEMSPQDAALMFEDLVRQCHSCKWKQYDNAAHLAYHA